MSSGHRPPADKGAFDRAAEALRRLAAGEEPTQPSSVPQDSGEPALEPAGANSEPAHTGALSGATPQASQPAPLPAVLAGAGSSPRGSGVEKDAGDGLGPLRAGDIVAASATCELNIPKTHAGTVLAVTEQGAAVSWTRMYPGKGSLAPIWIPADGGGHVDVVQRYAGG